ncbi:glycosyltransferase [Enterobacter hormaechei]|nr:glycosyltransferase [Enterobacter hormaechei]
MKCNDSIDVSLIIPVFNAEKNLPSLINSILSEKRVNFEIIVVDDGSTDNTNTLLKNITDERVILVEQPNSGVYAARNLALSMHRGRWVMFIDADDSVSKDFIYNRFSLAEQGNFDVVIFNGHRIGSDKKSAPRPVHHKQTYNKLLTGHEWIDICVKNKEWPHYLWLQIIKSEYIRKNKLCFQPGYSHKDIVWTVDLALKNGSFYISSHYDYTYIINTTSITQRKDYFDKRARSYIEVISYLIRCAHEQNNKSLKARLLCHALVETRHFLGLLRKKVINKHEIRLEFNENIDLANLFRGIRNMSDIFFFVKLIVKTKRRISQSYDVRR